LAPNASNLAIALYGVQGTGSKFGTTSVGFVVVVVGVADAFFGLVTNDAAGCVVDVTVGGGVDTSDVSGGGSAGAFSSLPKM
jgi:hypothetical protein